MTVLTRASNNQSVSLGIDSWAIYTSINYHTRTQVEALLQSFEIEMLQEEDHPGKTAIGEEKHCHIFHIVARKR